MSNIIKVIDFFKSQKNANFINYDSLEKLYIKYDSPLIKDCILLTLYDYIKNVSLPFAAFIDNQDVISFLSEYKNSKDFFIKHKESISKLESFLFAGHNEILNKEELIPYLIIESLIEYDRSNNFFIKSNKSLKLKYSRDIFTYIINVDETKSFVDNFKNKPFGFYICKAQGQKNTRFYSGHTFNVISYQPEGLYFHELHSEYEMHYGFRKQKLDVKDNLITKDHHIEIKYPESHKELSTDIKGTAFYQTINLLIYRTFTYWADLYKQDINKQGVIGFVNHNESVNYPALIDYTSKEIHNLTFDDLKFEDKYECLKFLDAKFESILDMNLVNFTSPEIEFISQFRHESEKHPYDIQKKFEFNKDYFNSIEITKHHINDTIKQANTNGIPFSSINPHFCGTKDELVNHTFRSAKINKIKLYTSYISIYIKRHQSSFEAEMETFIKGNADKLFSDKEFLKSISRSAVANISDRNMSNGLRSNGSPFFIINDESIFQNKNHNLARSCKDINFIDYKGKVKANRFFAFDCRNIEMLDIFKNKYNLKLSKDSTFFIQLFEAFHSLKSISKNDGVTSTDTIYSTLDLGIDVEQYLWNNFDTLFYTLIPMSKKHSDEIIEELKAIGKSEILDCNFGYSNGSRSFY